MHKNAKMKTVTSRLSRGVDFGTSSYERVKSTGTKEHLLGISSGCPAGPRRRRCPLRLVPFWTPPARHGELHAVGQAEYLCDGLEKGKWQMKPFRLSSARLHMHASTKHEPVKELSLPNVASVLASTDVVQCLLNRATVYIHAQRRHRANMDARWQRVQTISVSTGGEQKTGGSRRWKQIRNRKALVATRPPAGGKIAVFM